jgi:hypothetical protein
MAHLPGQAFAEEHGVDVGKLISASSYGMQ